MPRTMPPAPGAERGLTLRRIAPQPEVKKTHARSNHTRIEKLKKTNLLYFT